MFLAKILNYCSTKKKLNNKILYNLCKVIDNKGKHIFHTKKNVVYK